jgi:hypothetical protein
VLPAAQYASVIPAGNQAFAAQIPNKNLKIYTTQGGEIPLDSIVECKGALDNELFMAAVLKNKKQKLYGLLDSKGSWILPPVFTGAFQQYAFYFITNGKVTQPDQLHGVEVGLMWMEF